MKVISIFSSSLLSFFLSFIITALVQFLRATGSINGGRLRRILSLSVSTEDFSSATSSVQLIATSVAQMIDDLLIDGVEIDWQSPSTDENSKKDKANLVRFMKVGDILLTVPTFCFIHATNKRK